MKNLIYITADSNKSGVPVHIYNLCKQLNSEYKIVVMCPNGWLTKVLQNIENVEVVEIDIKPQNILKIRKLLLKYPKESIYHIHGVKSGLSGRLAMLRLNRRIIYSEHNWTKDYRLKQPWRKPFQLIILRILAHFTDNIVCVSNAVRDFYLDKHISPRSKLKVIHNGVIYFDWKHKESKNGLIFGSVGTLDYRKGFDVLIKAVSYLKEKHLKVYELTQFKILGSGAEKSKLMKMIKKYDLGEKFEFIESKTMDVKDFFNQIDAYIQPSRDESFGMALAEAIASGIPSIGSEVGGIPELFNTKTLLFDNEDYIELAEKIYQFVNRYDYYLNLFSTNKEKFINNYSVEFMAKNFKKFYKSL